MFVKVDECLPGSLLPSAVSSEHRPSLPQGSGGFSLADQFDLFRPRLIQLGLDLDARRDAVLRQMQEENTRLAQAVLS